MESIILVVLVAAILCLFADWLSSRAGCTEPVAHKPGSSRDPPLGPPDRVGDLRLQPEMAYHPAHSWALATGPERVRVGVDDFAARLVGEALGVDLPVVGDRVVQGRPGWALTRGGRRIPVLSPVTGRVAAVNSLVAVRPEVVGRDPYGEGWLLEVEAEDPTANLNNLLAGPMVRRWFDDARVRARARRHGDEGAADLDAAAREFLRTEVAGCPSTA